MKNSAETQITNCETKEISIIDFFVINTENGNVYAQIDGAKREIEKLNSGEYCFISKNKILEKTIWLGHFSKAGKLVNDKYANIFNETDQVRTENYFNS